MMPLLYHCSLVTVLSHALAGCNLGIAQPAGYNNPILLSYTEYRRLTVSQQKLSTLFHDSPLVEAELDLRCDRSAARPEPCL